MAVFDHEILIHYKSGGVVVMHVGVVVPTRPVVVLVLVVAKGVVVGSRPAG